MKCEDCLPVIEEYIDGELDKRSTDNLVAHMAECRACASYYEELRSEQDLYARYQRDIEVTPALWAGVRSRIRQEKASERPDLSTRLRGWFAGLLGTPRFSPALAALIVLLTVGITAGVMSYLHSKDSKRGSEIAVTNGNEQPPVDAGSTKPNPPQADQAQADKANREPNGQDQLALGGDKSGEKNAEKDMAESGSSTLAKSRKVTAAKQTAKAQPTPEQLIREAEQKYIAAINMLSRDVNRRRKDLSPEEIARFETTIAQIDHAISETSRAVRRNPDDPIALNYMLAAYSKKVEVLRDMARD